MSRMNRFRTTLLAAAAAMLAACAAPGGQPHDTPRLDLPAGTSAAAVAPDWWKRFGDAQLDALVDEALANNHDLARAMARILAGRGYTVRTGPRGGLTVGRSVSVAGRALSSRSI